MGPRDTPQLPRSLRTPIRRCSSCVDRTTSTRAAMSRSTIIVAVPITATPLRISLRCLNALILAAAPLLAASVEAADATPSSAAAATTEAAYRVVIDAPSSLKAMIERGVGLVRWQTYADMTPELLDRLAQEAQTEIRNIAAAEGYFSARVEVKVDHDAKPPVVTMTVTPGEPTRISDVDIDVTGPANADPLGTAAIVKLRDDWGLPKGEVFRQTAWSYVEGARARHAAREPLRRREDRSQPRGHRPGRARGQAVGRARQRAGVPLRRASRSKGFRSTRRRWCATTA